jgi:uncharacterized peroxidase-related enzyme
VARSDEAFVLQVKADHRQAGLAAQDVAMLDYAVKVTRTPGAMAAEDVTALRQAGWSDREILDICLVTAWRNFISRVGNGLGVELDEMFDRLDARYRDGLTSP